VSKKLKVTKNKYTQKVKKKERKAVSRRKVIKYSRLVKIPGHGRTVQLGEDELKKRKGGKTIRTREIKLSKRDQ